MKTEFNGLGAGGTTGQGFSIGCPEIPVDIDDGRVDVMERRALRISSSR